MYGSHYLNQYLDGFIVGLSKVGSKSIIMMVVYQPFKHFLFFALPHAFTSIIVAQIFMEHIFKSHDMSTSIVPNHDPTLTIKFWVALLNYKESS